ncbi:MAG: crossover junction endodeoxyribonuclease RuvC [Chitinophagales bacterium]|nr:crossover junction endodeoxyribonuclease RuvC [Bacteroidota bacterium]MCB9044385.1 crossover junction endodeoxyribonuclease RuvC [Chitinophagales bacterium]
MTQHTEKNIILGIDPGTQVFGYALLETEGKQATQLLSVGAVRLDKYEDAYHKLELIFRKISKLIETYKPTQMAIEAPFYGKNVQSMLKLGRAQGVAIACARIHKLVITEYSPKTIKQAITGNGNASKEQVAAMLQRLLQLDRLPKYYDATDALGVAVCHHLQQTSLLGNLGKGSTKNWKAFIEKNPHRIK